MQVNDIISEVDENESTVDNLQLTRQCSNQPIKSAANHSPSLTDDDVILNTNIELVKQERQGCGVG